jgi:hypothetical protein
MKKRFSPLKFLLCSLTVAGNLALVAQPCTTPSAVTANPMVICLGGSSDLNAISTGNNISWYTVPSGGVALATVASGANYTVTPGGTMTYYAEGVSGGSSGTQTFNYNGSSQSFTVPSGIYSIHILAKGARGGTSTNDSTTCGLIGGMGGSAEGDLSVTPGEVLTVYVGGRGKPGSAGGFNGGGTGCSNTVTCATGGGASDVRQGGTALTNRVIVAAGGGGAEYSACNGGGGAGGGLNGNNGTENGASVKNGRGGTPSAGGIAGVGNYNGQPGTLGLGGNSGNHPNGHAGGGGGGYYGGGGSSEDGHGGGGSSYLGGVTNGVTATGVQTGDGQIVFTWIASNCTPSPRVPVTVTLDNVAPTAVCQSISVTLDSQGNGSTTAAAADGGSTDNCAVDSLSLSQTAFTCANAGTSTIILTVFDGNGNTSTCAASVTVTGSNFAGSTSVDTTSCGYNVSCANASDGVAHAAGNGGCAAYTYLWSNGATSATATGLAAGMNYVTMTDAGGLTYIDSVWLSAPPAIQVTANTSPSCALNASGGINIAVAGGNDCLGYTYLWSNSALTEDLTNVGAGSYSVTVTDASGCTGTQSFTVGALPAPVPTFTQSGNLLTASQSWPTYQWLMNGSNIPGATNMTYTIAQTASYSLRVTDSVGCEGISDTTMIVSIDAQMGQWSDLAIFPNPSTGQFTLETGNPIGFPIQVLIRDMFGRTLRMENLQDLGQQQTFDIRNFAAGNYMVEVTSDLGHRKVFRLVVQ